MQGFSRLRFSAYARDLERAIWELHLGSLSELKAQLGDVPGIDTLDVTFGGGMQHITLNGQTASVGVNASTDEIRKALGLQSVTDNPSTPLPPNEIAPAAPKASPAPGSFAASIRAMMDEARAGVAQARADGLAKVKDAVGKLNDAKAQTAQVASAMAKTIEDEAASALAELGQISNFPPEG